MNPVEEDLGAFDPEAFFPARASAHTQVLHLRGGERFIAAEAIPVMYERMHKALDAIVAEQDAEDAYEFDGTCS